MYLYLSDFCWYLKLTLLCFCDVLYLMYIDGILTVPTLYWVCRQNSCEFMANTNNQISKKVRRQLISNDKNCFRAFDCRLLRHATLHSLFEITNLLHLVMLYIPHYLSSSICLKKIA